MVSFIEDIQKTHPLTNLALCFFNNRLEDQKLILKRFENCQPPNPLSEFSIKDINRDDVDEDKFDKIIKMSQIGYGSLLNNTFLITSQLSGLGKTYRIK